MADKRKPDKSKAKLSPAQLAALFGPAASSTASSAVNTPAKRRRPIPNTPLPDIAQESQKLLEDFSVQHNLPAQMLRSFLELTSRMAADPARLLRAQSEYWQQYIRIWEHSARRLIGKPDPDPLNASYDKRFKDVAWQDNPVFDFIKESYLLSASWLHRQVQGLDGLDRKARKRLEFYTRQYVDALSPSNFALTNPQVLRATLESGGENLRKGLANLLQDLEQGRIRMSDDKAFAVGKNLAVTPGAVIYENRLMQLIQYEASTPKVGALPLLIIPPWINKYYVLDLTAQNSFIRWAVTQGLTVFCISWVNPNASLAKVEFADYMQEGLLVALKEVLARSKVPQAHVLGYCLGGTLLASTLAWLKAKTDKRSSQIASASYFTTLVDFAEPGDLGIFIEDEWLDGLEVRMQRSGVLDAQQMMLTFNLLRANDLIWSFVVNNYLLGKEPFPFDLLYWNSDSTRLPAAMMRTYLRDLYQHNKLAKGNWQLDGVKLDLHKVTTPSYILSTRDDHIAPWASTYAATQLYRGPVTFVLAGSGHINGVVNPPESKKYQYWLNDALPPTPQDWFKGAAEHPGSWWPHWRSWLSSHDTRMVNARVITNALEPAPGRYVKVRSV